MLVTSERLRDALKKDRKELSQSLRQYSEALQNAQDNVTRYSALRDETIQAIGEIDQLLAKESD